MSPAPELSHGLTDAQADTLSESDIRALIRDSAGKFVRSSAAKGRTLNAATVGEMAELGWFGTLIPEAYGGLGLRFGEMAALLQELGRGLIAHRVLTSAAIASRIIFLGDNEGLKQRLLPRLADGSIASAFAWQESGNGSQFCRPGTVAEPTSSGARLTGRKNFVHGDADVQGYVVSARSGEGVGLYWVAADAAGLKTAQRLLADGSQMAELILDGVEVSSQDQVASAEIGMAAGERAVDEALVMISAEMVGVMREALDRTLDYLRNRVQFDRPIGSFQALQHQAVNLHIQRELAAAAVDSAVCLIDAAQADEARAHTASRAKSRASAAGLEITRAAIQLHGAIGFTEEYGIGRYLKRALVLSAMYGNAETHRSRISRLPARPSQEVGPDHSLLPISELQNVRDWNALGDDQFLAIAIRFFEDNCPSELKFLPNRQRWSRLEGWYRTLSKAGWLAPGMPREYGGMGLTPSKHLAYHEAVAISGAPRLIDQGINHVAPLLIAKGTPEQRERYVPAIMSGDHVWCQGYSEPNAGSDLASLRTAARLEGDEFVINGQKIWTSMAHDATHMFALVRTSKCEKKQDGITFLLIDLRQPGVTTRPIRNLNGDDDFCEVFLDEVRTHKSNVVGEVNKGWSIAKTLLGFERNVAGSPRRSLQILRHLDRLAEGASLSRDSIFFDRLTQLRLDVEDLASMYENFSRALVQGAETGHQVSVMKLWATETAQRLSELLVSAVGDSGAVVGGQDVGGELTDVLALFYNLRPLTIFGGSSEVQRNIVARRVLNLPTAK